MNKNIIKLGDFDTQDAETTVLHLVWQARALVGDAERSVESDTRERAHWCRRAAAMLDAAKHMYEHCCVTESQALPGLLDRSFSAAKAALDNGQIAAQYGDALERGPTDWERQHAPKTLAIFRRAAETARNEAHRALTELCEMYPDSMPSDEFPEVAPTDKAGQ